MKISNISTFRAFKSRNYTLYFTGRAVSQFGTAMQRTAVVWVIYTMTHSEFMLGLTLFAEQFPSFLLSIFGGIASDRYNRFKIIKITQIASMIQAGLLATLILMNHYVVWEILTLSVILGIINAFDIPARQSMIHEVVDENDLQSALSLNSAMANVAKLLGPALSGIILELFGAGICFLLNAASFGGVIISLIFMNLPKPEIIENGKNIYSEFVEGFKYLKENTSISLVIIMVSITSLLVLPYDTLIPVFAKEIFKGNAATYGYITSFIGIGAVSGTILLASLKQGKTLRKMLLFSSLILSIGLIFFSQISHFAPAMFFAVMMGFGAVAQFTTGNVIIQSESAPYIRGRIISILLTAFFGMVPLGSLVVGYVSEKIGASNTLLVQGIIGIIIVLVFTKILRNRRQPVI